MIVWISSATYTQGTWPCLSLRGSGIDASRREIEGRRLCHFPGSNFYSLTDEVGSIQTDLKATDRIAPTGWRDQTGPWT